MGVALVQKSVLVLGVQKRIFTLEMKTMNH